MFLDKLDVCTTTNGFIYTTLSDRLLSHEPWVAFSAFNLPEQLG